MLVVVNFWAALDEARTDYGVDFAKLGSVFLQNMLRFSLGLACVLVVLVVLSRLGILAWIVGLVSTFVWPMAPVTRKLAVSRFTRSLGLLLRSGVPVIDAVRKSAAATDNPYVERSLSKCVPAIEMGEPISVALSQCRYLSDMAREMIHSGEEAGKLDYHLEKIADLHEEEATQAARNLVLVFGILVFFVAAALVGVFVVRFWVNYYGAMFDELGI